MKKIYLLAILLILVSAAASAQRIRNNTHILRPERSQLRQDMLRLNSVQRNARGDEFVARPGKRNIQKAKCRKRRNVARSRIRVRRLI